MYLDALTRFFESEETRVLSGSGNEVLVWDVDDCVSELEVNCTLLVCLGAVNVPGCGSWSILLGRWEGLCNLLDNRGGKGADGVTTVHEYGQAATGLGVTGHDGAIILCDGDTVKGNHIAI